MSRPLLPLCLLALALQPGCHSKPGSTGDTGPAGLDSSDSAAANGGESGESGDSHTGADTGPDTGVDTSPDTDTAPTEEHAVSAIADDRPNFLLPELMTTDTARRVAIATSDMFPFLVQVDMETHELGRFLEYGTDELDQTVLLVTPDSMVWLGLYHDPWLVQIDPISGALETASPGLNAVSAGATVGNGDVVVSGPAGAKGEFLLVEVGPDRSVVATYPVVAPPAALSQANDGSLAVLERGENEGITFFASGTLVPGDHCPKDDAITLPPAAGVMAALDDGNFVVSFPDDVLLARCDGLPWTLVHVGAYNLGVVPWRDEVVVLDREGEEGAVNPARGVLRRFDHELNQIGDPVLTYIVSGHGALDAATGRVWMNAEGGGVLANIDPSDPGSLELVPLGQSVDLLATPTDDADHRVWFTGRLTQNVGWMDLLSGEILLSQEFDWPVGGLLREDGFWIISNTDGLLYQLDPDTLEVLHEYDVGSQTNGNLTFDDLKDSAARGTLFMTSAQDNRLLEIDPGTGALVGEWDLGGDPIEEFANIGRLELAFLSDDEVLTFRNNDGVATRINLTTGERTVRIIPPDGLDPGQVQIQQLHLREDGVMMVRGLPVDADTLTPLADDALPFSYMLAELTPERWLVWNKDAAAVQITDTAGTPLAESTVSFAELNDPHLFYDASRKRVVYTDIIRAAIVPIDLTDMLLEAGL